MEPHNTRHTRHSCDRPNTPRHTRHSSHSRYIPRHTHNSECDSVTAVMGVYRRNRL